MSEKINYAAVKVPPPYDAAHAQILFDDLLTKLTDDEAHSVVLANRDFFCWLIENSNYLTRLLVRHADIISSLAHLTADDCLDLVLTNLKNELAQISDRAAFMKRLRHAKGAVSLLIALCDISDHWPTMLAAEKLSLFADLSVEETLCFLLREAYAKSKLKAPARSDESGIVILAMGKHGAQELNYSSDIDIIYFYEPHQLDLSSQIEQGKFHIDLARDLSTILQSSTEDGYVFRVDLRLRPDPGSTPVALPIPAALAYYEGHGQNWERAAFIKARAIAGDLKAGQGFLDELSPFIWRRNLDFAAIEDVHSMKRQIHAVRGHGTIATAGHNIKLGRGGIREIEFFVQTQQLIAGGREPRLRGIKTLSVLQDLANLGWISQETATGLKQSYCYLRRLEHRLQMRQDEQTHSLPREAEALLRVANFSGYDDIYVFGNDLTQHLTYVAQEYGALFETSEALSADSGNLVFTGAEDDPGTLETLTAMGFQRPSDMSAIIRGWHTGRMRVMRSSRAREMLTRLKPQLLTSLARNGHADDTLLRFDKFLNGLPAGIQLFSMFQANPRMLDLVIDVIATAPRLAEWLSKNVNLLDVMMDDLDIDGVQDDDHMAQNLAAYLNRYKGDGIIERIDRTRLFVHEQQFALGVATLRDPQRALNYGKAYSALASAAVQDVLKAAIANMKAQHGEIVGSEMAIIALGKFGSNEMTITSDLDLIIVCDAPDFSVMSNGPKPLDCDTWFARAARRFLSGLSAPTPNGTLYEVDTRLRPSGNAGTLVTKLSGFTDYQNNEAWTWEHMALTRARVLSADSGLKAKLETAIDNIMRAPRDRSKVLADVAQMRQKLNDHRQAKSVWDVKLGRGGLFEIEFMAQTLALLNGHENPDILSAQTDILLKNIGQRDGTALNLDMNLLIEGWTVFSLLRHVLSLCVGSSQDGALPIFTQKLLMRVGNQPDIPRLINYINEMRDSIGAQFDRLLDS
ncbi:bifunctional [glutamine synthetase] adenylyltransferase/[glutamine synthetase]-adenylyl-L-tyrosine phosphorylase [Alphaproteobacteria bacterium]|nr:bifunctional [glutamine synthetase] adenylyltransferase/[glutamine synthetase]-adenylyl-L-tyrosine phosphorylase [Alphaproteobacteria bacterium]